MNKESLRKSIILIGPSCVGKSLIASEMEQKVQMNHVSLDDLLIMVEYEMEGDISPDIEKQKEFAKRILLQIMQDSKQKKNMAISKFEKKTFELIKDFFDLYNYYVELFGDLKVFYDIIEKHHLRLSYASSPVQKLANINIVAVQLTNKIFEIIDSPILIDAPAPFGWIPTNEELIEELEYGDLKREKKINFNKINREMSKILSSLNTILLVPGEDYNKRNTVRASVENNILLENIEDYYDNAKLIISTNGVFNQPESKFLQKRSWFNGEESIERDKLKNQCEISNICDQILNMINELEEQKTLS